MGPRAGCNSPFWVSSSARWTAKKKHVARPSAAAARTPVSSSSPPLLVVVAFWRAASGPASDAARSVSASAVLSRHVRGWSNTFSQTLLLKRGTSAQLAEHMGLPAAVKISFPRRVSTTAPTSERHSGEKLHAWKSRSSVQCGWWSPLRLRMQFFEQLESAGRQLDVFALQLARRLSKKVVGCKCAGLHFGCRRKLLWLKRGEGRRFPHFHSRE